jgi:hypothetical protein
LKVKRQVDKLKERLFENLSGGKIINNNNNNNNNNNCSITTLANGNQEGKYLLLTQSGK